MKGNRLACPADDFHGGQFDRRQFLELFRAAAVVGLASSPADSQGAHTMHGLIGKLTVVPGRREELINVLKGSAADMPGCLSYVVAKDSADENVVWVTEVWESQSSHDASLSLPAVKNAIPQGKALVSAFEKIAVTTPVWGAGLPRAKTA
ncbi:MAG TPA: putative quinol monooxygenase [Candidatus Acidoferrales bacterium]|nr:putative quinol monooxygenase [Candidatus Acidoferrales bacterium]